MAAAASSRARGEADTLHREVIFICEDYSIRGEDSRALMGVEGEVVVGGWAYDDLYGYSRQKTRVFNQRAGRRVAKNHFKIHTARLIGMFAYE
jgi:hypothetical protein